MLTTRLRSRVERWLSWWLALPTEKPKLSAGLAGILLGSAFPPVSLPGGVWLAFPLLWGLARHSRPYRLLYAALLLWNIIGCYWLTLTALSAPNWTEALLSFVAGAAAILANPLLMLLPFGIWRLLLRWVCYRKRQTHLALQPWDAFLFIPIWGAFEYFHFRWELSWSWLSLGLAWSEWQYWRNLASLLGTTGLSAWTLVGAAFLYNRRYGLFGAWVFVFPLLSLGLFPSERRVSSRVVYAIQPNIDPYAKFSDFPPQEQVKRLLSLLPEQPPAGAIIVLPETAIPTGVSLDNWVEEPFLKPFWGYVRKHRVNLLIGIVGYRYFPPGVSLPPSVHPLPQGGGYEAYNAALLLRPDTVQVHIKSRLVPFVERAPYLEVLSFLKRWHIDLGGGFGHFGKPAYQRPLTLYPDELPVAVGICYESIFIHDLRSRLPEEPSILAILTNDGWWKRSSGYWQHLAYGQFTASALGVPAVRSANTGVSALISASGERLSQLDYERIGLVQGTLFPQKPATVYHRWGEIGWVGLNTFAFLLWWMLRCPYRRSSLPFVA
ncbi:MAG: apolipoprotein N-acyltransferase [Bacteroidia bacterium]|nr:apolipoprotein N-acyltransferase [Bacteroidia bacterium]